MTAAAQGATLGGRYELRDRIAGGGMGEVWTAWDGILSRTVAVKVVKPGLSDDEGFATRFRNEARLAAQLTHGNIAQVYDFGEDKGTAYLVMEYVPGKSLGDIIDSGQGLPPDQAIALLTQAGEALQTAHEAGLVHRDVKPANILVTPRGTVKLTDFGIARALGEAKVTRTGEVMGTAQYLPPEAALGHEVTAQADVYSLAVVAYEMVTGHRPFHADSAVSLAMKHVSSPPPPLPDSLPWGLRQAILQGLAKDPNQRQRGAAAFARSLRQVGHAPTAAPYAPQQPAPAARPAPPGPAWTSGPQQSQAYSQQPVAAFTSGPQHQYPPQHTGPYGAQQWASGPQSGVKPPASQTSKNVGWAWVGAGLLTCLFLFLPFATLKAQTVNGTAHPSGSWNSFALGQAENIYNDAGSTGDGLGWVLLVITLIIVGLGVPQALGKPHISLPIIALLLCLLNGLIWAACMAVVDGTDDLESPLGYGVGIWLTGLVGTAVMAFVITAMVKRR